MTAAGLQRYQFMEALGAGSQGRTFRAIDRETGGSVAVKVLHLGSLGGDWKPFDLFERECQVLQTLGHPGIPRYLDRFANEQSGDFFLVMELIEGTPLSQRLGQAIAAEVLVSWIGQVLEILGYLHGLHPPVIHRDIKPSNLIVRPDGRLALIDFGGVRLALRPEGGSTMIGTFGYMAPEQLHGAATPATDIYALGATFAALAAGCPADQLPRKGLQIDVSAVVSAGALRDVLSAMLEPDPLRRLPDAPAVFAALRRVAGPKAAVPPPRTPEPEPPSSAVVATEARLAATLRGLPRFLRVFVWLWALMATGLVLVAEVVVVPLVFALRAVPPVFALRATGPRYRNPQRLKRLRAKEARAIGVVQVLRQRLQAIASSVDPRDPPALTERSGRNQRP